MYVSNMCHLDITWFAIIIIPEGAEYEESNNMFIYTNRHNELQ